MLKAITMVTKRFEITVVDPITRAEFEWFECEITRHAWDAGLTTGGRILMVEGPETIYELIEVLADHEFIHDVGLIKEVIDYEPQYDDEDLLITVDLNDN